MENAIASRLIRQLEQALAELPPERSPDLRRLESEKNLLQQFVEQTASLNESLLNGQLKLQLAFWRYSLMATRNRLQFYGSDSGFSPINDPLNQLADLLAPAINERAMSESTRANLEAWLAYASAEVRHRHPDYDVADCQARLDALSQVRNTAQWLKAYDFSRPFEISLNDRTELTEWLDRQVWPAMPEILATLKCDAPPQKSKSSPAHDSSAAALNSRQYYSHRLVSNLGTQRSAAQLHQQAVQDLEALETSLNSLVRFRYGSLQGSWAETIRSDPSNYLSTPSLSTHQTLNALTAWLEQLYQPAHPGSLPALLNLSPAPNQHAEAFRLTQAPAGNTLLLVNTGELSAIPLFEWAPRITLALATPVTTHRASAPFRVGTGLIKMHSKLQDKSLPLPDRLGILSVLASQTALAAADTGVHELAWTDKQVRSFLTTHTTLSSNAVTQALDTIHYSPATLAAAYTGFSEMNAVIGDASEAQKKQWFAAAEHYKTYPAALWPDIYRLSTINSSSD
ncbi:MAG: hypothetical protein KDI36_09580 [Pseudomonadales bacterium]|nr:hypothetical protein [Pseudomonadales bacterium]